MEVLLIYLNCFVFKTVVLNLIYTKHFAQFEFSRLVGATYSKSTSEDHCFLDCFRFMLNIKLGKILPSLDITFCGNQEKREILFVALLVMFVKSGWMFFLFRSGRDLSICMCILAYFLRS